MSSVDLEKKKKLKSRLRQTFQSRLCNFQKCMVTKAKLRIVRSWWKVFDLAAAIAKRMEAAWEWFQTNSLAFFQALWNPNDISVKRREQKPVVVWVKFGYRPMFKALKYICHTMLKHSFSQFTMHKHDGLQRPRVIICTEVQFQLFQAFLRLPHDAAPQSDS